MANRIVVQAYNEDSLDESIRGYFDGQKFIPKSGYCSSYEELYNYDYVRLFVQDEWRVHIPKRFFRNKLLKEMKRVYRNEFGTNEQIELFT